MFIPRCSSQVRRLRMMVPYVFIAILHTAILVAACESHDEFIPVAKDSPAEHQ